MIKTEVKEQNKQRVCAHLQLELLRLFVRQGDDGDLGDLVDFVVSR